MKQISQTIPYKGMIKSIGKRMEVKRRISHVLSGNICGCHRPVGFQKKDKPREM